MARTLRALLLLAALAPVSLSAQVPIGGEFLVNTATADDQYLTSAAMDAGGRFVVVWTDSYQYFRDPQFPFFTTISRGVYGRGFTESGRPYGPQFGVATGTTLGVFHASVAADGQDRFVVTWDHGAIDARRFAPDGTPAGAPVRVTGTGGGGLSDVAADPAGRFVVAWQQQESYQSARLVRARRFDAADAPAGDAFEVGPHSTSTWMHPSVAADAAGGFVIAWRGGPSQTSQDQRIMARVFDVDGTPGTAAFVVSAYTGEDPAVARVGDGRFIVAWVQRQYNGFQPGVFARVYEDDGSPVAGPFQVNATTTGRFFGVSAAADGPASFVVAWDEGPSFAENPPRHWPDVFARRFDTAGTPLSGAIQVNSDTAHGHSNWPEVSSDGQGHFIVAWTRWAGGADTMARRFGPEAIFADGFESGSVSAWSASAGGADLVVSPEAAMGGSSLGLQGNVNDTQPLFVQDESPRGEHRYRARFYFDPGDFDPGEAQGHFRTRLFIGFEEAPEQRRLFAVVLRRRDGEYALMARARADDNAQVGTGFVPITAAPHAVEIAWMRSTAVDSGDGSLELWVDGTLAGSVALDNDRSVLDFVRLGALSLKAGASGTLYWDEFESRRTSAIGP